MDEIKQSGEDPVTIVKVFNRVVNEQDVIEIYTIALDTETQAEIHALGFTEEALTLAEKLGIKTIESR